VLLVTGHCTTGQRHLEGIDKMANKLYTSMEWLKKRYHLDKKTPEQIAAECGVSVETIYVYLAKFGLRKSKR
jgi:anaerobic selenocysteine-containing dehydrogenase